MKCNMELSLYEKIQDPVAAAISLGQAIAESGLFGCSKTEQGVVLAMQSLATGRPLLEIAQTYHIIDGKLSMRSDVMLARFLSGGGKVIWKERTSEAVSALFKYRDNELVFSATIEEFKRNEVALRNDGQMKKTWRTHPRQMLTARVISEAVRLLAPELVCGFYSPEEVADFDGGSESVAPPTETRVERTIEVSVVDDAPPVAEDWKCLGDKQDLAIRYFIEKGLLKDGQTLENLPAKVKQDIRKRTSALLKALEQLDDVKL
jgi:hypothetical protein